MKYEKDSYSEGVSICCLIFAGIFIYWGITNLFAGFFPPWGGIISLAIGISIIISQIRRVTNRDKLRNVVKYEFEANPNSTVEEIVDKTKISRKDVQAIVLDLKARGELKGKFSSDTGQMKQIPKEAAAEPKGKFCPSCGTPMKSPDAKFCEFCGAKVD